MLKKTDCALCGAPFNNDLDGWQRELAANEHAGAALCQPQRTYLKDAYGGLGLGMGDDLCVPCWVDRVHPAAWGLQVADA